MIPKISNQHSTTAELQHESATKVFVTGGTGLVGSHLIQQLLQQGYFVKALYRKKTPEIFHEKLEWLQGDILDLVLLEQGLEQIEEVYHCAAVVSFAKNEEMYKTNIEGTANVVNASINAGVKKLCYVSSVAALGKSANQLINEHEMLAGNLESRYSKSKHAAEMEVWRGITEGLCAVIVNPSIVLGAADWNTTSSKIFKTAYEAFPYYTDGERGFVDVADVVNAMLQLMQSNISGERFIVSAENVAYKKLFSEIAKAFGKKPPQKKVSKLFANILWRLESVKSMLTKAEPLLTRETVNAAYDTMRYDNSKLLSFLPSFSYTPLNETIQRVCGDLKAKYKL